MANKTFVAKNGLTANTANVFFSQLATNLTPTAGGLILFADSSGKIGTRTEAQILTDIGGVASGTEITAIAAGDGMNTSTAATSGTATITLGTPTTLTVTTSSAVSGTTHEHAITASADTSGGASALLKSDGSGNLKVNDLESGGDLVVGDDATLKSDSAVLGFGLHTDVTLTHVADTALLLNTTRQIQFGDAGTYIYQSADAALDVVSDGSVNITTGAAGVVLKGTTPKLTVGDAGAEDTMIVFDGNATDIRMGIDDSGDLFEIGTGATHATTPAITIDTSQIVNLVNNPKFGGTAIGSTAAELNLLDGSAKSTASITIAAADAFVVIDGTSTKQIPASDIITYVEGGAGAFGATAFSGHITPNASGTINIGSGTAEFNDLYLADGSVIYFGNDQEITLTHNADKGLTLKHEATADDIFPTFTLATKQTDIEVSDVIGSIEFIAPDEGSGTADQDLLAGAIRVVSEGDFADDSNASKMSFMLGVSEAATEKMFLSSGGNLTINGNLNVLGTTTTVSSTVVSIADPIFELGASASDDNLDRGIKMKYHSGTAAKIAFMGYDDSDGKFVVIPDATDTSNVLSGTPGTIKANLEGTVQTAAQGSITSLGTLTTLTVDNVIINGTTIGHTADDNLLTLADGIITVAGEISVTTLDIAGTNVASTAAELNIVDGGTAATSTTLLPADRVVVNDNGTMVQVAMSDFETFMESNLDTLSSVTTVGALNTGSITSGFTSIDVGSGAISTTGTLTYGTLNDGTTALGTTVAELNLIDGGTGRGTTTVASGDGILINDGGVMRMTNVDTVSTYFAGHTVGGTNIVTTGALDTGSITSGFGTIDTGASAISTTGVTTAGSVVITNESTIGSAGDTNAVIIGATGTVALTQNEIVYGASNSSVGVAMTKTFSGTVAAEGTATILTFKAKDGTSGQTGATNYLGGEVVLTLKLGSDYETKKIMIHQDGDPTDGGADIFITEFATLGVELGETIATDMGAIDGTSAVGNGDEHVWLTLTAPSGGAVKYAGVAHLVEVPGDS